jgi:hypothetical protein
VTALINYSHEQEQRAGVDAVIDHLHHAAVHAVRIERKQSEHDHAHRRHRRISDKFLDVAISLNDEVHRRERSIDDAHDREKHDNAAHAKTPEVALILRSPREHRQVEPVEPVSSELQQDAGEDH